MVVKIVVLAAIVGAAGITSLKPVYAQTSTEALIRTALSENSSQEEAAITQLRAKGPSIIQTFLSVYGDNLTKNSSAVLDAICQQRDCQASRLYWYTDLEQAKAAAKNSGKPILSLRLLGKLTEELSCANSRFFRIALYANADISKFLREHYILHWQSVRPAPKLTVDFGDGRKLERTITGNSIHYILDAEGKPIDALPGLYGPQAFLRNIARAEKFFKEYAAKTREEREEFLRQYHRDALKEMEISWADSLSKLGINLPLETVANNPQPTREPPTALEAAPLAMAKMAVEMPVVREISPILEQSFLQALDNSTWVRIADLHAADSRLDANSKALMQLKSLQAERALANFEKALALDTVRNEYIFRRQLHQWFIQGNSTNNVDILNERVYTELFLTPNSDPWLGLFSPDIFTGIENDGVVQ